MYLFLYFQMSSSVKASINGKCTRPEHHRCCAHSGQHDGNPRITDMGHCHPQLDHYNQRSHERRPESDEKKYSGARTNKVRNHGRGQRWLCEMDNAQPGKNDCGYNALQQKADTRPAIGECRVKSLQDLPPLRS